MKLFILILFLAVNVFSTQAPSSGPFAMWEPLDAFIRQNIPDSEIKSLLQNAELIEVNEIDQQVNFIYQTNDETIIGVDFSLNENGQAEDIDGKIIDEEEPQSLFEEVEEEVQEMVDECKQAEKELITTIISESRQIVAEAKQRSEEARKKIDSEVVVEEGEDESEDEKTLVAVIEDDDGIVLEKVYTPSQGVTIYVENSQQKQDSIVLMVNTETGQVLSVEKSFLKLMNIEGQEKQVVVTVSYSKEIINGNQGIIRKTSQIRDKEGNLIDESVEEETIDME